MYSVLLYEPAQGRAYVCSPEFTYTPAQAWSGTLDATRSCADHRQPGVDCLSAVY